VEGIKRLSFGKYLPAEDVLLANHPFNVSQDTMDFVKPLAVESVNLVRGTA
jgi:hypothetical protein